MPLAFLRLQRLHRLHRIVGERLRRLLRLRSRGGLMLLRSWRLEKPTLVLVAWELLRLT